MWAQLITTRLKPGRENDLAQLVEAEIFEGGMEFVDLMVVDEVSPRALVG